MKISDLEDALAAQFMAAAKLPFPRREYRFHPFRQWRFDFAWPALKLAAEVEGGTYGKGGGRHTRGSGFRADCEKYNEAALLGWRVLRFDAKMVRDGTALSTLIRAFGMLEAAKEKAAL